MSTIQTLTSAQIEQYKQILLEEGIGRVPSIYDELNNMGFGYAGWAYGVATGDSITGISALGFMQETAERSGTSIDSALIEQIRIGMLDGYLDALLAKATDNGGSVNEDIRFDAIHAFHTQVFNTAGLSIDYWTLETPMKIISENLGLDVVDQIWREITETQGTGPDALAISLSLVNWVTEASYGTIYLDQDNHLITHTELRDHSLSAALSIARIIDVSAYVTEAEQWLAKESLIDHLETGGNFILNQFFGQSSYWKIGDQSQANQNDTIFVPSNNIESYIYGLGGNDKLYGWDATVNLGEPIDLGPGAKDHLYGGTGDDELYGRGNQDQLFGGMGSDKLDGGTGNDHLDGGQGIDELYGGEDNDYLNGENGNDIIYGYDGENVIVGGAVFNRLAFAKYLKDPLYDQLVQESLPYIKKNNRFKSYGDWKVEHVYDEVEKRYNDVIS